MRAETSRDHLLLTDFATIFAHNWYRDFPLQQAHRSNAQRADWTIHLGVAVRSTADLLGLFTHFETGGRTDAVIKDATGSAIAALEWEWIRLHRHPNELKKLTKKCCGGDFPGLRFACLIGYSKDGEASSDLADIAKQWGSVPVPLLLTVVHFTWRNKQRLFTKMVLHVIQDGTASVLRQQPAYPWEVERSRWSCVADGAK